VELSRLSDVDISRIIGDRMRLHPDLAVRIVERADGNPHDAVSIVTSLIAEGRLRTTEHGYGLSDDRPLAADSDDEGFAEIVSNVFLHFGRDGRDALELAAALGDRLSRREWRLIAGEAHTSIAPGLETALETRGVIQTDADGFRFVSRGFRRRVIAESRERNDWRSRVAVCRSALSEDGTPRAAQWDFDVGAYLSAANTWLGLADQAARKSEVHAALQMLRRAGEAASKLSGEGIERLQTEIDVRKAELWARERIEDAESMASRVEQQARRHGWDELLARALLARASYARKRVALDEARSLYREARDLHERLGNTRELAVCMQGLGMCAVASGDLDAAEHHYDLALGHALPARDLAAAAWCANGLGDVYRKQGELAVAQSWYERALNWFDTVGDTYGAMWCVHDLAQTKRARGELGAAEADYERTIRIARQLGQRVVAPRLNLGIVRVQRGDYDGARSAFEEVLEESRARDIPGEEGIARICLLPCEATAGRWEEVARQLRKGRELIGTLVDQDLGQMAAIASEIARDAGRDDIATQLAEFARAQA
jgi:tetratricopeptide (TPR) repeat protein